MGRAGDRCALNLADQDISKDAIRRGDMVLDARIACADGSHRREAARAAGRGKANRPMVSGAAASRRGRGRRPYRLARRRADPAGASADVQLVLDRPIAAAVPDRFVIRDVIGAAHDRRRSFHRSASSGRGEGVRRSGERSARRWQSADPWPHSRPCWRRRRLRGISRVSLGIGPCPPRKRIGSPTELGTRPFAVRRVEDRRFARTAGGFSLQASWKSLLAYHAENPDQQGIGREKLRLMLQPRLPAPVFVIALQKSGPQRRIGSGRLLRSPGRAYGPPDAQDEAAWSVIARLLGGAERFRPPRVRDIAETTGQQERDVRRLLKLAGRMGWADEVAHDHFFLRLPSAR